MRPGKKESIRSRITTHEDSRVTRPRLKGTGAHKSPHRIAHVCCPICWSKDYTMLYKFWSSGDLISKCNSCKHHFIPDYSFSGKFSNLVEDNIEWTYHTNLSRYIKSLILEKMTSKKEVKIFIPFIYDASLITLLTRELRPTIRNRIDVQNQNNASKKIKFYSLWNSNKGLSRNYQIPQNKTTYGYIDLGYDAKKCIHNRHDIIAKGIRDLQDDVGKFDISIVENILSRVTDPDPIIKSVLSSSNYFAFINKVTTSQKMLEYGYEINRDMSNISEIRYPILESKWEKRCAKEQLQFYSEESLRLLFDFNYSQIDPDDQPKGKYRAFKNSTLKSLGSDIACSHNFPGSIITS